MQVNIREIKVSSPHRIDNGNLEEMKQTIQQYGMLHPILIRELPGESPYRYELITGYRRLKVVEELGWQAVPVTLFHPQDILVQFDMAMEENMKRKDFNPLEIYELLIERKRLWEQKHGDIKKGRPKEGETSSANPEKYG